MGKGHTATTAQRRFTCATILLFLLLAPAWGWGQKTFYTYKNGNWNTAATWTLDPTGTTPIGAAIPTIADNVVIRNGDVVTFSGTPKIGVKAIEIESGATLDLGNSSGHALGDVNGKGLLRISSTALPAFGNGNFDSVDGGTVEIYAGTSINLSAEATYNNLILNFTNSTNKLTIGGLSSYNFTVNGDLTIKQGGLQINDDITGNNGKNIIINGNTTINSSGQVLVGDSKDGMSHSVSFKGDFINNGGSVKFYTTYIDWWGRTKMSGYATVTFNNPSKDQLLQCNGITKFWNLLVDKGVDDTYMLDVQANAAGNFTIDGSFTRDISKPDDPGNVENNKALEIYAGTLRLGQNISLTGIATNRNSFAIDSDAQLWLDGASVSTKSTGTIRDECLIIYGKLKITGSSTFSSPGSEGIIIRGAGIYEQSGGTSTAGVLRTSARGNFGEHRGGVIMTGGNLTITGNVSAGQYAAFTLPYLSNIFQMSGDAVLDIKASTSSGDVGDGRSILLSMDPKNASLTGGTVIVRADNRDAGIVSTVPFYDLQTFGSYRNSVLISNYAGYTDNSYVDNAPMPKVDKQPLVVLNDFTINGNVIFNAKNMDVTIGEDMLISANSTYTPGTNTTRFNGSRPQTYTNNGTANLNNVELVGASTYLTTKTDMQVNGDLTIGDGTTLYDEGKTVTVDGNITNSGKHVSTGSGSVTMSGSGSTIGGSGNGVFGVLALTGGNATLAANQTFAGSTSALRLVNGLLDIGSYRLTLGPNASVFSDFGAGSSFTAAKMVKTGGLLSDEGVVKDYRGGTYTYPYSFTYPVGFGSSYHPATLKLNVAPTLLGQVTVKPVSGAHPLANATKSLACYWKTSATKFEGLSADWAFKYIPSSDIKPNASDKVNYIGALFRNNGWITDQSVVSIDKPNDNITSTNQSLVDGEYAAGLPAAFTAPKIFYSITATGNWDVASTWSSTPGGPAGTTTPDASSIVVIGEGLNGSTSNHEVIIPAALSSAVCKRLTIKSGSILNVKIPTGTPTRNFGYIADQTQGGGGTLKVELAAATALPGGDFSDFCGVNGGTVEYYGAESRILPAPPQGTYYNLVLSPDPSVRYTFASGKNTIYNDLTYSGKASNSQVVTSTTSTSISVGGSLLLKQGGFYFWNTGTHKLDVAKDVLVDAEANLRITGGSGHTISIGENLRADGSFDARYAITTFKGVVSGVVSGSSNVYINDLVVDKGVSASTRLTVSNSNTTINGSTSLLNGELLINGGATLNINHPTGSGFTIPSTAALTVNNSSAKVTVNSNAFGNDGDILLFGTLGIKQGNLYVGPANGLYNYDIEIGASGEPTIRVDGGNLYVGGQIRRSVAQFVGSLRYYQNGGTVHILGKSQNDRPNYSLSTFRNSQRAKFEVLNPGSVFSMKGGTLRIAEGGGVNFGDIYVDPESSAVTGGVVELGSSGSNSKSIKLSASCLLPSVVVGSSITATNTIYPLRLLNDLTIISSGTFKANGLDLAIGRSLFNYTPNTGFQHDAAPGATQTTTFNSSVDGQIVGSSGSSVTFSSLVVNKPSAKLTLGTTSNVLVEKLLDLSAGTFQDKGNTITVKGDMKNTGIHESDANAATGVVFDGAIAYGTAQVAQRVWSDVKGVFGNVTIKNGTGVTFDDEFTLNNRLTFSKGILNIDENLLRLGVNAEISGTTDNTKYIMTNGIYRDKGVEKEFPKLATEVKFVYPIGVAGGKYTPATITLSNNNVDKGSVRVLPINSEHPMLVDPANKGQNLDYYWIVEPSDNLAGYTAKMQFDYVSTKTFDANSKVGRFIGDNWNELGGIATDAVIESSNKRFTISSKDFLKGEYTIAHKDNLYGKPVYYSVKDGNWDAGSTWKVKKPEESTYTTPAAGPNGHRVIVNTGHTVTITQDTRQAYSLELNGTLDLGSKIYHDFRKLSGVGTLKIGAFGGQFLPPGGDLTAFTNQNTSTIELNGNGTLDARFTDFPNLNFTGAGDKVMPISLNSRYHTVYGNLTISAGVVKKLGSSNQGILRLYGSWDNKAGAGAWVPGTSQVQLVGDGAQAVSVVGATPEQFYNLQLQKNQNSQKVSFSSSVDVTNLLSLNRGVIDVAIGKVLRLTSTGVGYTRSGYAILDAFVDGAMQKSMLSGSTFNFPVGDVDHSAPVSVVSTSTSATPCYWETQYYKASPSVVGSSFDNAQLSSISDREYWRIKNISSGATDKAYVRLQWDDFSGMPTVSQSMSKIRVAEYNGSMWNSVSDVANVDKTAKTVQTSTQRPNANADKFYTLSLAGMPTAVISTPNPTEICGGESTNITLTMTGVGPWKIQYAVDGVTPVPLDVPTSPFTFALTGSAIGSAVDKDVDHKVKVVYVKDATGDENYLASNEVGVKVKRTPNPVITGPNPSMQSAVGVKYSVVGVAGDAYSWSISNGTITAGQGTKEVTVTWGTTSPGTISVTETSPARIAPSTSCPVTASLLVSLDTKPKPKIVANPIDAPCVNGIVAYSTTNYSGNTYLWNIPGISGTDYDIVLGSSSSASVSIRWKTAGSRQLKVTETKNGTSDVDLMDIQVNAYPLADRGVSDVSVCKGKSATISVANSESGASYQLYDGTGTAVGAAINGNGSTITIAPTISVPKGVYTSYEVRANIGKCQTPLTDKPQITVFDPIPTLVSDKGTDVCSGDPIKFTAYDNAVAPAGTVTFYLNGNPVPADKVVDNIYTTATLVNGDKVYAVINNGACSVNAPELTMTVKQCQPSDPVNSPTVDNASACVSTASQTNVTNVALDKLPAGATSLTWSVTAGSGTITSTDLLTAKVVWEVGYSGKATISVKGKNLSGESVNSKTVDVTVVKVNPGTIKIVLGEPACFKMGTPVDLSNDVTASVNPSATPTYSWELQTDDGAGGWQASWQSISGANTSTYSITTMDIGVQKVLKMQVRRVAYSSGCADVSNTVTVNRQPITGPPYHIGNSVAK
jgi:hypothetical protein